MITTNDMGRYLSDETGNSRYLPARLLAEIIDLDTIRLILPQLFAQAKYLWDTGKVVPRLEPVELAMQKAMVSTREVRPNYYYWILEKLKLHHRKMDESENYDDGFTMDEMLSWMESEDWYSKSTKAKHRDEIRKALPKYFHIESVHKYIPEIHRINSADSSYTRKWRYKGSIPWIKFLDSLDD